MRPSEKDKQPIETDAKMRDIIVAGLIGGCRLDDMDGIAKNRRTISDVRDWRAKHTDAKSSVRAATLGWYDIDGNY